MMNTDIRWLLIISSVMLVLGKDCITIHEYLHRDLGCQPCPGCTKGTGINLTQKINRTTHVMYQCYTCENCPRDTYQDKEYLVETCKQCDTCPNRQILRNCSKTENSICGDCLPGYFVQLNKESIICDSKSENITAMIFGILWGFTLVIIIFLLYKLYGKGKLCFNKNNKELNSLKDISMNNCEEESIGDISMNNCEEESIGAKLETQELETDSNDDSGYNYEKNPSKDDSGHNYEKNLSKDKTWFSRIWKYFRDKPKLRIAEASSRVKSLDASKELLPERAGDVSNSTEKDQPEDPDWYEVVDDNIFALKIGKDWKALAHMLKFIQAEIDEIELSEVLLRDCSFTMIKKYRQKYLSENNELIKNLILLKRFDLLKRKSINNGSLGIEQM